MCFWIWILFKQIRERVLYWLTFYILLLYFTLNDSFIFIFTKESIGFDFHHDSFEQVLFRNFSKILINLQTFSIHQYSIEKYYWNHLQTFILPSCQDLWNNVEISSYITPKHFLYSVSFVHQLLRASLTKMWEKLLR